MNKESMVFVGAFNDSELMGEEIKKAKKEHGLPFIVSKLIKKEGKTVGIKVWGCDYETFEKHGGLGL